MSDASTIDRERQRCGSPADRATGTPLFREEVAAVFPLPLTTFEKYMLWDDRPDYPMAFVVQLKLIGTVEREAFVAAVHDALARHPLLCSVVHKRPRGGPVWVLAPGLEPRVLWGRLGEPIGDPLGTWIDLESEVGLRVWVHGGVADGLDTAEMTFQFHHACCDGSGSLRFIGDVLAAYGVRTAAAGLRPVLPACDAAQLSSRGTLPPRPAAARRRVGGLMASLRESILWLIQRPSVLRDGGTAPPNAAQDLFFDSADWHTFNHAEARGIRQAAMLRGVTMNDLLLREMFQSLHQWNGGQEKDVVRITLPVSTNQASKGQRTAVNGISYSFLTRRGRDCADSHALLQGLLRENDSPTRRRRARAFLSIFSIFERIPGVISLFMRSNRCFATAVFSNLGDIVRHFGAEFPLDKGRVVAGTLVLDEILGFPPIRPHTRAAFMIGRYAGRCRICVRCDPAAFAPQDVHALLASYVERLRVAMETV